MSEYHEDLALRLVAIKEINDEWRDLTKRYGAKVAKELREIAPSDPTILYDLSAITLVDSGATVEQAIKTVDSYTPKEWQNELEGARPIITNTIKKALRKAKQDEKTRK